MISGTRGMQHPDAETSTSLSRSSRKRISKHSTLMIEVDLFLYIYINRMQTQ